MSTPPHKLLSFVLAGRNDNYLGDFKYRLATCINYLARNLNRLGRLDDVEILVTDWNSDAPLCEALPVSAEAAEVCRFVRVPPEEARDKQRPGQVFNAPCAINVGLRRARGKFAMMMPADVLLPTPSLQILLSLLDGDLEMPFEADACLMLCGRKRIPWDIVRRQPALDEWDRYLLLSGGSLERDEKWLPGVGICCSALAMAVPLWHACRGFDEGLSYWGWSDAELTLRITQRYPWLELLGFGVATYDMETASAEDHAARPVRENPHIVPESFAVNDDDWGLGDRELVSEAAKCIAATPDAAEQEKSSVRTRRQIVAELVGPKTEAHLLRSTQTWWPIEPEEWAGLWALAWYCAHCSLTRYLEFGIRDGYSAAVVAVANCTAEIYVVDPWRDENGGPAPTPFNPTGLIHRTGYRGYLRLVTGDPRTALERLQDSTPGPLACDLAYIRGELLGTAAVQCLCEIVPCLTEEGMVVFMGESKTAFENAWADVHAKLRGVGLLRIGRTTGLILARPFADSDDDGDLAVDICRPPRLPPGPQVWRHLRALMRPRMYAEYARRIWRWTKYYLQN